MSKRLETLREEYRVKFAKEVISELKNAEEEYARKRIEEQEKEEIHQKHILEELRQRFPLYSSQPATIHHERYGNMSLYPFHKKTHFSKPVNEVYDSCHKIA